MQVLSRSGAPRYCEICGTPITTGKLHKVAIDGAMLVVCEQCLNRLASNKNKSLINNSTISQQSRQSNIGVARKTQHQGQKLRSHIDKRNLNVYERFELVDDYAERIRKAREARGWSQATLAVKVKVSENIIKRIEGGKLRPSHDLAKKFEEVLNIKLLMPVIEEGINEKKDISKEVTLGEVVNLKEE
uniref:TIGR00270 family protein n=1 Tax=Ignisphaera aggregans TaxID=334771 RepID=A0A7C4BD38_9CREN